LCEVSFFARWEALLAHSWVGSFFIPKGWLNIYEDWHIQKYASGDDEVRYVDEDEDSISDQFWQRIKKHNK
jgi:hypothetical protein